jgi:23S rRNA pseudouridine1911/1915/1917 synthase
MTNLELIVNEDEKGYRLDKYLALKCPDLSRSRIQTLIESGHIKVNNQTKEPSYRLKNQEKILITIPPLEEATPQAQEIPLNIVYEDQDVVVINKEAGMVVHPAPGNPHSTLVNALLAHCGKTLSGISGIKRPGIVHRLDKGTSGLMVVAKNDKAHKALSEQFADRTLSRRYYAIVWKVPHPLEGTISTFIGRSPSNRKKMAVLSAKGKNAITHYKVLETYGSIASLVECRLETGRTHQIRVHMSFIKHPLLGDPVYGKIPKGTPVMVQEKIKALTSGYQRPALHAYQLSFRHPTTNELQTFTGSLPEDIKGIVDFLKKLKT